MSKLFSIMIMWVLVYNGLCPQGLALGYTIAIGVCILITSSFEAVTKTLKERKEDEEKLEEMFKTLDNLK